MTTSLLLLVITLQSPAAGGPGQFLSENGRYAVELSRTADDRILVTVFQKTAEGKALHWSRSVYWEPPYPGLAGSPVVQEIKALVTNDGKSVVLRDENTPEEKNGINIYGRGEGENGMTRLFDRRELTGCKPAKEFPPEQEYTRGMRGGVSYMHLAALLDFILDDEKNYAVWFGQTDRWAVISLETAEVTVVKDPRKISELNQIAYRRAQELVSLHQPAPLRRMFTALQASVAKIAPSLAPLYQSRHIPAETAASYLFLATRKNSSDRSYIEHLVQYPSEGIQDGYGRTDSKFDIGYSVTGHERAIGDYLLSRWNGETNREVLLRETYLLLPDDSLHYLGSINVDLELPMKISPTNAGIVWAYVIPNRVPAGDWNRSSDVIPFRTYLQFPPFQTGEPIGPKGQATFRYLSPGEYRLKMIWERNPPAGLWRTNIYTGLPGDYESAETPPIQVEAGEIAGPISLSSTNRIGKPGPSEVAN